MVLVVAILAAVLATGAWAASTHFFKVRLSIKANETSRSIGGEVLSKAPSEFCNESKLRIRQVLPGKNQVVAKVKPVRGIWHFDVPHKLSGKRLYAEVSGYHLPSRPVVCRAARSHVVTAP